MVAEGHSSSLGPSITKLRPSSRRRNFKKSLSSRLPCKRRRHMTTSTAVSRRDPPPSYLVSEGLVLVSGPSQVDGGEPADRTVRPTS